MRHDAFDWIGLLNIATALHILPSDAISRHRRRNLLGYTFGYPNDYCTIAIQRQKLAINFAAIMKLPFFGSNLEKDLS